jgi:murein DD-endopeptidase MepM/ murein hydrolase activator NlpD
MPNYNISVKVDPSGANAGVNVVEQRLTNVTNKAKVAQTALQRAFDFNASPAVSSASTVEKAIEHVSAAEVKAAGGWDAWVTAAKAAHAQVNSTVENTANNIDKNNKRIINSAGQVRASQVQLGQQFNDFSTQVLSGGSVVTAFAQQSGQAAFALQGMNGTLGTVGKFLAGPWGTILIIATTVLAGFVAKHIELNSELDKAADKLKEDARQTDIDRQAKELYRHSEEGLVAAIRDRIAAMKDAEEKQRTQGEQDNRLAQTQQNLAKQTRDATKALLERALAQYRIQQVQSGAVGPRGELATLGTDTTSRQAAALQSLLDKNEQAMKDAETLFTNSLVELADEAAKRAADPVEAIRQKYEGRDGILNSIERAATGEQKLTAERAKQLGVTALLNNGEKDISTNREKQLALTRALTEARRKEAQEIRDASKAEHEHTGEILALPVTGGRITTRFGQTETGVGVGAHTHQGVDIATPVGTPVYARAGGTVDFARQQGNYGNVIQINFGGGVTARYGHLQRFNVKPGDVVDAGDIVGFSGGARGAPGSGDSTGPHLHYEERVGGRAVNPLTTKVNIDEVGAQTAGYNKAEQAAKSAAEKAQAEKDFVTKTIDAANQTALPKIDTVTAKIKTVMDSYKAQFHETMTAADAAQVTKALTDAEARATAQHFQQAYVDPLKPLQEGLGKTAVEQRILTATMKEEADQGRPLSEVQQQLIKNYYEREDVLKREDEILRSIRQPLEDYANKLAALNDLLGKGKIAQSSYNDQVAQLGSAARSTIKDIPGKDPNTGQSYSDISAVGEEDARYAHQIDMLNQNRAQLLQLGLNWDALEEAARRDHVQRLNDIDNARQQMMIEGAMSVSDSLLSITKDLFGEQSKAYKAMFVISKAFAIADAALKMQQAIAQASALPFPANIPAIIAAVAAGASIVANIKAISLQFADGGLVRGQGSGRSDSIPASLSDGEFVVNAESTKRNYGLLKAINDNKSMALADGGAVGRVVASSSTDTATSGGTPATAANPKDPKEGTGDSGLSAAAAALEKAAADLSEAAKKLHGGSKTKSLLGAVGGFLIGGIGGAIIGSQLFKADGGIVRGQGSGRSDSIPARLSDGEFVVNAESTRRNYAMLKAINDNSATSFATGGFATQRAFNDNPVQQEPTQRVYNRAPTAASRPGGRDGQGAGGGRAAAGPTNVQVPIQIINVASKEAALAALRSEEGTTHILNTIEENPNFIAAVANRVAA